MATSRVERKTLDARSAEISMLRFAAMALDLRDALPPRFVARSRALRQVLDGCEALFEELGWGRPQDDIADPSQNPDAA